MRSPVTAPAPLQLCLGERSSSVAHRWIGTRGESTLWAATARRLKTSAQTSAGAALWHGSMIRRVLMSPRIAGLKEHRGEIVGEATWPAIIDRATHDRLVGLLVDGADRPANYGRPRVHPRWLCSTAGHAVGGWSATSSRGRVAATGAGKTRTQTARPGCESPPSRWRRTSRAT